MRHEPAPSLGRPPRDPEAATAPRSPGRLAPPRWRIIAGGWAAAFVLGVLFALVIRAMGDWNAGAPWERAIMHRVHAVPVADWANVVLMRAADIGTNRSLFPVCLALALLFWRRARRDLALWVMTVELGALSLNWSIKSLLPRERPELWEKVGWYGYSHAYASGHVIASIAVLTTLALLAARERGWRWPLLLVAVVVLLNAFGRMYHGVHWPSDVYGGALVGSVWLLASAVGFNVLPGWRARDER